MSLQVEVVTINFWKILSSGLRLHNALPQVIAGVDDAGRGPIIGPLVIAGILLPEEKHEDLRTMGARDSKLLTPAQRLRLNTTIRNVALKVSLVEAQPQEIDDVVLHGEKLRKLNYLEARMMAEVISELEPNAVYVDASDVNEARFGEDIRAFLPASLKDLRIISEHHADRTYPVVSAASIIAKVRRDSMIEALWRQYGDFGSGYITDPKTMDFLRKWRRTHTQYPPIVRLSWKTVKELEDEIAQSRLGT